MPLQWADRKKVFIIYGRNGPARAAVERFLESLKLIPWSFPQIARDQGMEHHTSDIVRKGMRQAHGIVALFTPEEFSILHETLHKESDEESDRRRWQARPNVLFEAGMAYGIAPERTILVLFGPKIKLFSDVAAIPYLVLADTLESREAFRDRLIGIGCDADQRTMSWTRVDLSCPFDLSGASLDSAAGAGSGTGGNAAWVEKRAARGDKDAIRELPGLGSPQAFGILESVILTNPLEDVRQAAIVAMASLDDPRKIDVLGGILVAEKWTVAKTCAEALGRTRNALAAPYLIRAIELNVDWVTAQASAEALGLLPAAPAGMRALVMALNRGSFQGIAAKQSLVRFSLEAAPALRENLRRRLKGEALRLTLDALRLIGDRDALPPLRELESSVTDPADRLAVQEAIEALSEAPAGD